MASSSLNQPASARPLRPHFAAHIFAQLLVFIFLSVLLARLIALLESLEARTCISLQVAQLLAALLLLLCSATPASASGHPTNLACWEPLFSLLLDTVSDKTEGDGSREAIEGMSMSTELNEATRRRSRSVKTTGNIPGNAPSRCWEAHVQHEHAVPVRDLGAQVPTA